jgi:hypothetical protein
MRSQLLRLSINIHSHDNRALITPLRDMDEITILHPDLRSLLGYSGHGSIYGLGTKSQRMSLYHPLRLIYPRVRLPFLLPYNVAKDKG